MDSRVSKFDRDEDNPSNGERLQYDQKFKGPLSKRSCTDVFWLLIFVTFLAGWCYIGNYAIRNGDLNKILAPTDSFNRKCGVDAEVKDKKYLFFFNLEKCIDPLVPISGCPTPQVCVSECPTESFVWDTAKNKLSLDDLKKKLICQKEQIKNSFNSIDDIEKAIKSNLCAPWYAKSKPLSKRCVPQDVEGINRLIQDIHISPELTKLTERMLNADLNGMGENIVEDIISSWSTIALVLVITMVASLVFIAAMRWIAAPLVWLSILGVLIGLGIGLYLCIGEYTFWKNTSKTPNHSLNLSSTVKNIFQEPTVWLCVSITVGIFFVVIFLLVIVLRKRIRIAVALVKEGSKAVSGIISTVFFPVFPWLLFMCTIAISVIIGLYLASVGDPSFIVTQSADSAEQCKCENEAINYTRGAQCNPLVFQKNCFVKPEQNSPCVETGCFFEKIANPKIVTYFQIYNFFGFLWLSFFISALGEMVLAGTFAAWYWSFHKSDVPYFVLTKALARTVRYHLGTLALGSLIVSICRFIRCVLEYIDHVLKKYDNSVTRAILCCMKCFFWCLEKFLRFINKNAYIMCAIHGKNFFASAKDSFNLLMRNFLRVIAVAQVTSFLFFLSKLLLTGGAGVSTYYYFKTGQSDTHLNYVAVPITIVVIATYLITSVFFGVYSMAIDTLFLCFLEDCERNDGSEEKPYFMSKQLMKILHKKNENSN